MSENRKVRTCVVGGGRIGTIHMQNVSRNSRMTLAAFVDVDQERAKQIHAEYGVATYSSLEELFAANADGIDAVIICSPTKTHVDYINICIRQGKPTFCEKPISLDPTEIQTVYQFAEAQKVPLLCGYHRRHDLSFKTLQEAIVNGEIGQVRTIRSCSRDNPIPLNSFLAISGGILHDCASHDIDVLRWIAREEPIEVFASASTFIERIKELNDWDTVSIHMKFPSGILGTVDICRSAPYGYDQRIEVLGEHGMLQAENQRPTTVVRSTVDGVRVDPNCFSFPQRYSQTYALELDHFCDIILKGATPAVTGADCYRDAVIIQKCEDSVHSGLPQKVSFD